MELARVVKLITGKDNHTRGAILHVPSSGHAGVLQRPIQRLYPIETTAESVLENTTEDCDTKQDINCDIEQERPRRSAASEARKGIAACAALELT